VPVAPRVESSPQSPSTASARPSPRRPALEPAPEAPAFPTPASTRAWPAVDVVGRLVTKDRHAAERELTALLGRVGAIELGRQHGLSDTVVDIVVPRSAHGEFAGGLARIGSWQLEAARSPLPDGVHLNIRVGK